ncbi:MULTISPECIES: hypothetical protein [Methylobacter]|jgi:hypothetical protein|uniref:Lipoprotein n=2 Tax=Methylobacter tundripaludum TaxID=173365 RepID=G3IWD7_METTV|nr:hypothetical protein [Methylobacter tundripaludum]EGW23072.1 hypothetical protein Mettu_1910 [Methylobacter tundripaludum SV96]MDD4905261.1 hypothetical protein [Methylobacter tundripaludum]PPK78305.1 hypothetical protein B0F87_101687 [Methylobacter tundripaludum]
MKTPTFTKNFFFAALTSMVIALAVTGCSDDEQKTAAAKPAAANVVHNPFDHSHDGEVTDIQKHKFEHDFASQCVDRELKNSTNKEFDKVRYATPCMCIAKFLMKDLTAEEAEKFIGEHKNAQSLVIKYENAAYHCLQQNAHPKGPDFSRAPQQAN